MSHKAEAVEIFTKGLTCSQAVAAAFARQFGMDTDTVLKVSRGFGGGMGGMGGPCGAVSGAYMVLGMSYELDDPSAKAKLYADVQEFTRRFRQRHGQIDCRDLLGCDVSSEAGKALMREKNMRDTHCAIYVRDAVELVEEMLASRA